MVPRSGHECSAGYSNTHPENRRIYRRFLALLERRKRAQYPRTFSSFLKVIHSLERYPLPIKTVQDAGHLFGVGPAMEKTFESFLEQQQQQQKGSCEMDEYNKEDYVESMADYIVTLKRRISTFVQSNNYFKAHIIERVDLYKPLRYSSSWTFVLILGLYESQFQSNRMIWEQIIDIFHVIRQQMPNVKLKNTGFLHLLHERQIIDIALADEFLNVKRSFNRRFKHLYQYSLTNKGREVYKEIIVTIPMNLRIVARPIGSTRELAWCGNEEPCTDNGGDPVNGTDAAKSFGNPEANGVNAQYNKHKTHVDEGVTHGKPAENDATQGAGVIGKLNKLVDSISTSTDLRTLVDITSKIENIKNETTVKNKTAYSERVNDGEITHYSSAQTSTLPAASQDSYNKHPCVASCMDDENSGLDSNLEIVNYSDSLLNDKHEWLGNVERSNFSGLLDREEMPCGSGSLQGAESPSKPYEEVGSIEFMFDGSSNSNNNCYKVVMVVDNREIHDAMGRYHRKLCNAFTAANKPLEFRQLPIGDVIWLLKIKDGGNIIEFVLDWIVERKTSTDLMASITDGRYESQKSRLLALDGFQHIIYLLEDVAIESAGARLAKMGPRAASTVSAISTAKYSSQFVTGFNILKCNDMGHTIKCLLYMHTKVEALVAERLLLSKCATSDKHSLLRWAQKSNIYTYMQWSKRNRKRSHLNYYTILGRQLRCIPGCGANLVTAILATWPTATHLATALETLTLTEINRILATQVPRGDRRHKALMNKSVYEMCRRFYLEC